MLLIWKTESLLNLVRNLSNSSESEDFEFTFETVVCGLFVHPANIIINITVNFLFISFYRINNISTMTQSIPSRKTNLDLKVQV